MSGVRSTARWQRLCKVLIRQASMCALCGYPLDKAAPARSRYSPSVDHIVPLSLGGAPYDPANLRVAHNGCNAGRGNATRRSTRSQPVTRPPAAPETPSDTDCSAVWPHARADLHAWMQGACPDPENCPRVARASEAAMANYRRQEAA